MDPYLAELNELLVRAYRSIVKVEEVMLRDLSDTRLTISEMHLLERIGADRTLGRTVTDLAQELDITLPSVTVALKRLEKKGYVTKNRCSEDGRRVRVKLTGEGLRAEIAHRYFHRQMVRAVAGELDENERRALIAGVRKLDLFLRGKIEDAER
ncbi:MAG: MarR family transcriptional regulator, partial [Christensenellaceae bacterium]|nr:MarR family transcriptional regulator [Christensenellaceae bacterium]